eukprot:NODE_16264_length_1004_cov_1.905359.p1 GENE.NODE_16264_length_1004_cov_1.905359~~NODE_16264_length_1004_cov_1.905359.p1  ORF type:complete len:163 (+),score=26.27 NODE_16264_length_1004_cov_1.905359:164-652(+)
MPLHHPADKTSRSASWPGPCNIFTAARGSAKPYTARRCTGGAALCAPEPQSAAMWQEPPVIGWWPALTVYEATAALGGTAADGTQGSVEHCSRKPAARARRTASGMSVKTEPAGALVSLTQWAASREARLERTCVARAAGNCAGAPWRAAGVAQPRPANQSS